MADVLSTGITELAARLNYHKATGGIISGMKVHTKPTERALGEMDMPSVIMFGVSYEERADANPRETNSGDVIVSLRLCVDDSNGLDGLLTKLASLLDAIETNTSGEVDLKVGGSSINGISVRTPDTEATSVGLNIQVDVTIGTIPFRRGNRRRA